MHKLPGRARRAAPRGEARRRRLCRVPQAPRCPGRRQYELVRRRRGVPARQGLPRQFHDHGLGRPRRARHDAAVGPPHRAGDLVTTELTPAVEGYYAQICRTLVVGKATAAQRRAHAVYREALEAGIAAVRPGATAADVARAENDVFRKYGLGDYVTDHYTRVRGHGLGLFADSQAAYPRGRRHRAGGRAWRSSSIPTPIIPRSATWCWATPCS